MSKNAGKYNKNVSLIVLALVLFSLLVQPNTTRADNAEVTIYASKVVCKNESDLPNWGMGGNGSPAFIDQKTAKKYVENSNGNCELGVNWSFQYGFHKNEENAGVHKLMGYHIGKADGTPSNCEYQCGPNTNTGPDYNDWKNFETTTQSDGTPAKVVIDYSDEVPGIWVRENLQTGFIPFTYPPQENKEDNVTAETYCHYDIENYDNYDLIYNPEANKTYFCVSFNVPKPEETYVDLSVEKTNDMDLINPDQEFDYEITVKNIGTTDVTNVTVEDEVPQSLQIIDADGGTVDNNKVMWTIDSLEQGQEVKFTLKVKLIDSSVETVKNTATVYDDGDNGEDVNPENNVSTDEDDVTTTEVKLTLSKENNTNGKAKEAEGSVKFTLTVKSTEAIDEVVVTDLFSEEFSYVGGSWEAESNQKGDIKESGQVLEPVYSSPAKWTIGTMNKNEEIKLTYVAKISEDIDPGNYKDLAWAKGDYKNNLVLSNSVNNPFVGTEVKVEQDKEEDEEDIKVDREKGEVLSAIELPRTGLSTMLLVMALIPGLVGFGLWFSRRNKYGRDLVENMIKKLKTIKIGMFVMVLALAIVGSTNTYAATLNLRVERPESPYNDNFKIDFVALDVSNQEVNVECMIKKPSEDSFNTFNAQTLKAGGNSGQCDVTDSLVKKEGTYEFKVKASNESETVESEVLKVKMLFSDPEDLEEMEVEKIEECKYKVTVRLSDDENNYETLEIYRSEDREFELNNDSRIVEIDVEDEKDTYSYTDELDGDCDKNYYYAARAIDAAGNYSDPISTGSSRNTQTTTTSSSSNNNSEVVVTGTSDTEEVSEETQNEEESTESGDVLGEENQDEFTEEEEIVDESNNKNLFVIATLILVGLATAKVLYDTRIKKG